MDWLRPLLRMFYAPSSALAEVRDRAPLGAAVAVALVAQSGYLLYVLWPYLPGAGAGVFTAAGPVGLASVVWKAVSAILFTAIVYVPVVIFVANVLERRGGFGAALQQEYAAVASTVLYARAASCILALPFAMLWRATGAERVIYPQWLEMLDTFERQNGSSAAARLTEYPFLYPESFATALLLFPLVLLTAVAVRQVFRLSWARAAAAVGASGLIMLPLAGVVGPLFDQIFRSVVATIFGFPLLLIILFLLMRGYIGEVLRSKRARASFRQNLEAATLNPADASAHYNLGLIHLQRRELSEARTRFERAVEIDPEEVDAHFQLGRVARAEGRLPDAIKHFEQVVVRAPAHAQNEIWREIGATYVAAGQHADAEDALRRFLDQRQSDPEGLYLMGRALAGLGRTREAADWMRACIEAVRTAPAYKYRAEKRWMSEAQQFLRSLAA
ncbi:MAG TPA: tetratricopeptide repeat protein [Pyrinomonadaceae bacterium]|nr:tetratricopeptide repeat protein [Pyrinomonadaceae bacterium]